MPTASPAYRSPRGAAHRRPARRSESTPRSGCQQPSEQVVGPEHRVAPAGRPHPGQRGPKQPRTPRARPPRRRTAAGARASAEQAGEPEVRRRRRTLGVLPRCARQPQGSCRRSAISSRRGPRRCPGGARYRAADDPPPLVRLPRHVHAGDRAAPGGVPDGERRAPRSAGTAAMESAVANVCSPGDRVLVVSHGYFGERWAAIAQRYGLDVDHLRYEWGELPSPDEVGARLRGDRRREGRLPHAFGHVDRRCRRRGGDRERLAGSGALVAVDAISSLAAVPLETDEWGLDIVLTSSHKALMCWRPRRLPRSLRPPSRRPRPPRSRATTWTGSGPSPRRRWARRPSRRRSSCAASTSPST